MGFQFEGDPEYAMHVLDQRVEILEPGSGYKQHRFELSLDYATKKAVWGAVLQLGQLPTNQCRLYANVFPRLSWVFRAFEGSAPSICAPQYVYLCFQTAFPDRLTNTAPERLSYDEVYKIVVDNVGRLSKRKL